MTPTIRLLISCPDTRGIIAAVTDFIAQHDGNIVDLDQHSDLEHGEFHMRVELEQSSFKLDARAFDAAWRPIAERFKMHWAVAWGDRRRRMAIFVSKLTHCLSDVIWRWQNREFEVDVPVVISNHETARPIAEAAGLTVETCPITPGTKAAQESRLLEILRAHKVDLIVLARYMQILTVRFVDRYPNRIINIHHGFLPAFRGGSPYKQAYQRGVKMIGATSHYVTEVLDDGPIIAQDTVATSHRDTIDDLTRKGRDLERIVLARSIRLHLEDRILVANNRTVVFD